MGVRSQLSWLVKGRVATQSTLQSLTTDLQALQRKVEAIEAHVNSISKELPLLRDRQGRRCRCGCHERCDGQGRRATSTGREAVSTGESPAERLARWTATDLA